MLIVNFNAYSLAWTIQMARKSGAADSIVRGCFLIVVPRILVAL